MAVSCVWRVHVYLNWVIFSLTCAVSPPVRPSVPAALGRLHVGWVCGKPRGEGSGCMLHAPLSSVRVTRQPLVWPATSKPEWKLRIWCGRTVQAFPLKIGVMLFIFGRSFLQKDRNGRVCSRLESYVNHMDVLGVFDTPTQGLIIDLKMFHYDELYAPMIFQLLHKVLLL